MKTTLGIQQRDSGLRRAAYLIHCSLIPKKDRIGATEWMPLPFDREDTKSNVFDRLKKRQLELNKQENARRGT
jgi:hypothetical protein